LPVFVGDAGINAMGLYWDLYGEGYEYHIYLRELSTENDFELVEKTDALDYTLMDLKPGTDYLIRVEAWWPGADSYDAVGEVSASTMEDMFLWRTINFIRNIGYIFI